jgi:hypothetical protein
MAMSSPNEQPERILETLNKQLKSWDRWANRSLLFKVIFASLATVLSTLSAAFTDHPLAVKWLSVSATTATVIAAAIDLLGGPRNWRYAWRKLKVSFLRYQAGAIDIRELIDVYSEAENAIVLMQHSQPDEPNGKEPGTNGSESPTPQAQSPSTPTQTPIEPK